MTANPQMAKFVVETDDGKIILWVGPSEDGSVQVVEIETEREPDEMLRVWLNDALIHGALRGET